MQLIALTLEEVVAAHHNLNVKVASRTGVGASFTLTLQLNSGSRVNAGWNFNCEVSAVTNPSLSGAFNARVRDGASVPLASGAGA